jgi:hypothetical protein
MDWDFADVRVTIEKLSVSLDREHEIVRGLEAKLGEEDSRINGRIDKLI